MIESIRGQTVIERNTRQERKSERAQESGGRE